MREEFHGIDHGDGTYTYKQLYNWNSVNCNIWLPSLSELVGTAGTKNPDNGCYNSAMQEINLSTAYQHVDAQGGNQFVYFQQYNTSGGGEKLWNACNQQISWMRSTPCWRGDTVWCIINANALYTNLATLSYAVHPAGEGRTENKLILLRKCRN